MSRPAGYKLSEETKAKIGNANRGRVMSLEARAKNAAARRGRKLSASHAEKLRVHLLHVRDAETPEAKARRYHKASATLLAHLRDGLVRPSMLGRKHRLETKAKMSLARKRWFASLSPDEKSAYMQKTHDAAHTANEDRLLRTGRKLPEASGRAIAAGRRAWFRTDEAKRKFFKNTSPERAFALLMGSLAIPVKRQFDVSGHMWDFFVPPNMVVDIDGCYWHGCPIHYPESMAAAKSGRRLGQGVRDAQAGAGATAAGYVPLRVWEHDLKHIVRKDGASDTAGLLS